MLLQSDTFMRNIKDKVNSIYNNDFSSATRLSILLRSTFKYMYHPENQVFKSLPFADTCTALLGHICSEMHIPNYLELLSSSYRTF